jgi:hypothetical protein
VSVRKSVEAYIDSNRALRLCGGYLQLPEALSVESAAERGKADLQQEGVWPRSRR